MKPNFAIEAARFVMMTDDYTTSSFNLGQRTYKHDCLYQLTQTLIQEIIDAGKGRQFRESDCPIGANFQRSVPDLSFADRPLIPVISKVSRWFTANGVDTHYLTEGGEASVPSNLAAFLVVHGYAEYAA
jgi:hypothetical protein